MSKQQKISSADPTQVLTKPSWLGKPPLLPGEDPAAYDDMLARISVSVLPSDAIEEIWVREIVDLTWDIFRLRRLKVEFMAANRYRGLALLLEIWSDFEDPTEIAMLWATRDAKTLGLVDKLLATAGLTIEAADAQTLGIKLDDIERIDRMIMNAEVRRNVTFREIDRHRSMFAAAVQQSVKEFEDAKYTVVESE